MPEKIAVNPSRKGQSKNSLVFLSLKIIYLQHLKVSNVELQPLLRAGPFESVTEPVLC